MSVILHHGDCLDVMKDISDASLDLIICDLPYGCLTGGGITKIETAEKYGRKGTEGISGCAWDIKIDLDAFWKEVKRIRRNDHSPTIHFCTTRFGAELIASNPKEFRYDLVWSKSNAVGFLSANKKPMSSHEMIYVFSKVGAYYERIDILGNFPYNGGGRSSANFLPIADMPNIKKDNTGKRCVKSVIDFPNKKTKGGHPTAKPIDLYTWLLQRYCPPGGTVMDPTFGSANSAQASWDLGLSYIGIEKDPGFFESAKKRFEAQVDDTTIQHL